MERTDTPMLLLYAAPGVLVPPAAVPWYTARIKRLETVYLGQGFHFVQEDQPDAIGRALSDWLRRLEAASHPAGERAERSRLPRSDRAARLPPRRDPA
jgi:hypothetical protein